MLNWLMGRVFRQDVRCAVDPDPAPEVEWDLTEEAWQMLRLCDKRAYCAHNPRWIAARNAVKDDIPF